MRKISALLVAAVAAFGLTAAAAPPRHSTPPNLRYWGGLVTHTTAVELVYWGSWWDQPGGSQAEVKAYLKDYFSGIVTPQDKWSPIISQYKDQFLGQPDIGSGHGVYDPKLVWVDPSTPPREATLSQFRAEAEKAAQHFRAMGVKAQILEYIMSPQGTHPEGFHNVPQQDDFCGRHEAGWFRSGGNYWEFTYVDLPWVAGDRSCWAYSVKGAPNGALQSFSINAGHEFAEAMSDPFWQYAYLTPPPGVKQTVPPFGWTGAVNGKPSASEEAGDRCSPGVNPAFPERLPTGTFAQPRLWDNRTHTCQETVTGRPPLWG